jgi:fibronectin-binding autotransporter adhesin
VAYINPKITDTLSKPILCAEPALYNGSLRLILPSTGEKSTRSFHFPILSAIVLMVILVYSGNSFAQTTIVNYNFNAGTSYATLTPTLASNISCTISSTDTWQTVTGITSGTGAFTSNTTAGKAVKMARNKTWTFSLSGTEIDNYSSFKIYYQASSTTNKGVLSFAYSLDGTNYITTGITVVLGAIAFAPNTTFKECQLNLPTTLDNPGSPIYFRLSTSTSSGTPTFNLDNFQVQAIYNSISTSALSGSSFCAGDNVLVPYTINGPFVSGNTFTAELSNASGNFAPPVPIGTLTSTAAGTISATIPAGTPAGSGYRIRVSSDNPTIKGFDNGSNLTINIPPSITSQPVAPVATCSGSGTQTLSVSATGTGLSYSWRKGGVAVVNSSIISGQGTATLTLTNSTTSQAGSYDVVVTGTCNSVNSDAVTVTVNLPTSITTQPATPAATCSGTGTQTLTVAATGTGLSYSWRKGGVAVTNNSITSGQGTATLTLTNPTISEAGSYNVVITGSCTTATSNAVSVTVNRDGYWTGAVSTDWNTLNNWECGELPDAATDVLIANGKSRYPLLSAGTAGSVKNLILESAATLTVAGNTLNIAGTINTNATGIFTASSGTIELNGSTAQTIPANTFAGNTVMGLTINNSAGVTLGGALNISGIVSPASGVLNAGGYLTLLSSSSQTALVSGTGNGSISGNINIQRYISNTFGYKYMSSPVGGATVSQLSGYLSTTATIPAIYRYDENNMNAGAAISGWVNYATGSNPLNIMEGYAVNLGSTASTGVVTLTGTVNNGSYSKTLYNHNRIYTQGFNLVGNPYPSPIDWNAASGWTRTNIDGAIYFFSANGDEYSGTYSSYTNGIAGADGDNIIPAMQGFFVHVSNGMASGTLGMNNSVRINKMNPSFKSAEVDYRKILRFNASFDGNTSIPDPFVLYFDPSSTTNFDPESDALKLMNTNQSVPNIYAITQDVNQLSISGMPMPTDSLTRIPLGVKVLKNGWINFSAKDIEQLPASFYLYLYDSENKSYNDLKMSPNYRFYLTSGEYNQRFALVISKSDLNIIPPETAKPFNVTRNGSAYLANILPGRMESGTLYVRNMAGQTIQEFVVDGQQNIEICQGVKSGVYIVTFVSGGRNFSEKTLIRRE